MSTKVILGVSAIVLSVAVAVGMNFVKTEDRNELNKQSSDTQKYERTITLYKDSFEGYRIACSDHMEGLLRRAKTRLNCVDDGADYGERMKALKSGKADFAMVELGAYVIEGERYKYPASIVSVIDTSSGADALVAHKDKIASIEDLRNNPNTDIGVTLNSPSDVFGKITGSHFDLEALKDKKNLVSAEGSEDVVKMLLREEVPAGIVWEPHVSKLLSTGDFVKIVSTAEAQDTIVDALVVNREFGEENPNIVKSFLSAYYQSLKYYNDNPDKLIEEILADPINKGMKEKEAKEMVKGINWVNLNTNCKKWFACDPNDWAAKVKVVDTLEMANKVWNEYGELDENVFPEEDAYTLINSEFIYDLLKNGVGLYSTEEKIGRVSCRERVCMFV